MDDNHEELAWTLYDFDDATMNDMDQFHDEELSWTLYDTHDLGMNDMDLFYHQLLNPPQYMQNYVFKQMLSGLIRPMHSLLSIFIAIIVSPEINIFINSFIERQFGGYLNILRTMTNILSNTSFLANVNANNNIKNVNLKW